MEASKSPTPDEFTIPGSSLVDTSGVYGGSHTIYQYVNRDNAAPMTVMMDKHREWSRSQNVEFNGDLRCVGHVMSLPTVALLSYTIFKGKASKNFDKNMEELP